MPIKLTVTPKDESSVAPTIFVLSLPPPEGSSLKKPDVCLATDFRPKGGKLVLNTKAGPVSVSTDPAVLSTRTKTYYYATFSNDTINSCNLSGGFDKNIKSREDATKADDESRSIYPENAKRNYYRLMVSGVRVIFTKAVAFNTILTIRTLII